ncbi:MAG: PIN domain-containing protein [Sphingomicrobium sp.]
MYLLDTDVVWALRGAASGEADSGLTSWAAGIAPTAMFISAVTLMEFESGASKLERRDKANAAAIRSWIEGPLSKAFDGRVLPINAAVVKRWARLAYADQRDGLLAATALEHGLTLVTASTAAFKAGRVRTMNPWGFTPETSAVEWEDASLTGSLWLKSLFR